MLCLLSVVCWESNDEWQIRASYYMYSRIARSLTHSDEAQAQLEARCYTPSNAAEEERCAVSSSSILTHEHTYTQRISQYRSANGLPMILAEARMNLLASEYVDTMLYYIMRLTRHHRWSR